MSLDDITRITTWLRSRLPDHEIRIAEQAETVEWRIFADEDVPPSRLRIPEGYFNPGGLATDQLLDVLERNDFPEMVESEDGICRIVTRSEAGPAGEVALAEC